MKKPKAAILKAEGTNFDEETAWAFKLAGADADVVLVKEVIKHPKLLEKYQIVDFPGGFSYGDDLYSGKILANEVNTYIRVHLDQFIKKGGLIIGVCNGFQVLVRAGILPGFGIFNRTIGLIYNQKQKFECRWIQLKLNISRCGFLKDIDFPRLGKLPVEHGEGRFIAGTGVVNTLVLKKQIVFQYVDDKGNPTNKYPQNPNGSIQSIAGICDTTGQILGMMPHPEHHMKTWQYPNWRRDKNIVPWGLHIYKSAITFCKSM